MTNLKRAIKSVKDVQSLQCQSLTDDYMIGLYNGLEMALAIMEEREPNFEVCSHNPEIIENDEKQESGRTVCSGIKRKT
jgi:hypothetical protein